jgi:hypothetical protein
MKSVRIFRRAALAAALSAAFALPAFAAADAHDHGTAGSAALELNQGKKWQTDEPLRKGMTNMRTALAGDLKVIHANKATPEQYEALAKKLNGEVAYVVENCKLDPKADAELHKVIAEVMGGADAMQGNDPHADRRAGAVRVAKALNAYGKYFNHPGWRNL